MNFSDNWVRVFVAINLLRFGEARITGEIAPILITFGVFLVEIGFFAFAGKMAEMHVIKKFSVSEESSSD